MREILIIGVQVVILAGFVAMVLFYGFVFWHWRIDAKRRNLRGDSWPTSVAHSKPPSRTWLNW
jgi:hypothetical protein